MIGYGYWNAALILESVFKAQVEAGEAEGGGEGTEGMAFVRFCVSPFAGRETKQSDPGSESPLIADVVKNAT